MDNTRENLDKALAAMLGSDDLVSHWWSSPNHAFDGKTPLEMFQEDQRKVIGYVISYLQK
jgi:hypothetical protein